MEGTAPRTRGSLSRASFCFPRMSDHWHRTPQAQERERQLVLSTPRKRQAYFQESTLQHARAERGKVESAARPARGGEESRRSPVPPRALHVSSRLLSGRAAGLTLPGGLSLSPGQATSRLRPREPPEFPVRPPPTELRPTAGLGEAGASRRETARTSFDGNQHAGERRPRPTPHASSRPQLQPPPTR